MAIPEHLEILSEGVEKWNQWRKDNPKVIPDLNEVDLEEADLSRANLSRANLSKADLFKANLSSADLTKAILEWADLRGADFSNADLSDALLDWADLSWARCYKANLSRASLGATRLIDTNFDGATLTGAALWETQRAQWSIKGVICECVFWDERHKEKSSYSPGEFERLFADKTKVKLFYKDGINPLEIATLPALIKHLEESHPGSVLRLVSIHEDSGGVVVELAIEDDGNFTSDQLTQLKAALETEARQKIEYQKQALAERETRLRLEGEIKQLDSVVNKLILRPTIHQGDSYMGDNYNISGQAGAIGPSAHAHDMTFNQLQQIGSRIAESMDLTALASELEVLRQALKKEAATEEHDVAVVDVGNAKKAAEAKDSAKLAESLKSAGKWALDVATKIGVSLATEAVKHSMGMK